MNTSKQVNIMIGSVFAAFVLFVGYMGYESTRQAHAREEITERVAERGARIYVNNCRTCHGLEGEGHVGPPLNTKAFLLLRPGNRYGLEPTPQGESDAVQGFLFNTLACGRTNTFMPLWAQRFGGSLSDTQISQLVTLITEGRWDIVREIAVDHDPEIYADQLVPPLPSSAELAKLPRGEQRRLAAERNALVEHEVVEMREQIENGLYPEIIKKGQSAALVQDPSSLSITEKNCGQFSAETAADIRGRDPLAAALSAPAAGAAPPAASSAPAAPPAPGTIVVDLLDTLKLSSVPTSAPAGAVTFRADNKGAIIHELAVYKTDLAPEAIPIMAGRADEARVQVVGRTKNLPGKQREDLRYNLQAGKYVLACNIPAHYQSGMRTAFTVE